MKLCENVFVQPQEKSVNLNSGIRSNNFSCAKTAKVIAVGFTQFLKYSYFKAFCAEQMFNHREQKARKKKNQQDVKDIYPRN